jgi:hypothetical protein
MRKTFSLPTILLAISTLIAYSAMGCEDKDNFTPMLEVHSSSLTLNSAAQSTDTFKIISNTEWTISSGAEWLSLTPASGTGNAKITAAADENTDFTSRSATVKVTADGVSSKLVEVTQSRALSVSSNEITIDPEEGSTEKFVINSEGKWTISASEDWISFSPESGTGNATVTITVLSNPDSEPRIATITVTEAGATAQSVDLIQGGNPCDPADDNQFCEVAGCVIPELPSYNDLTENPYLPDPFEFLDGSRVTSQADWTCRQAEISALAQKFQYGYKPCIPYDATTGSFSGNTITVTVQENGRSISFDCSITYPTTGQAPYPAVIGIGFSFLNNQQLLDLGVAVINFPQDEIALQDNAGSRGTGKFYDLYCSSHSAGAIIAWSWGVSRLIDALEKTPAANIDPLHLAVTGCSRNGKGALAPGAFDERIALTIPQESGSGGAASWRVSDFQGSSVQRLRQIVTENTWFRKNFDQFSTSVDKVPYDHHSIMGLCAPRGLLVIENTSMEWLGNLSTWTAGNAAHKIWEALGVPDNMGFSQTGHSDHCGLPESQEPEVEAFVRKFLLEEENVNTSIMKTDGNLTFDEDKWINWSVPTL